MIKTMLLVLAVGTLALLGLRDRDGPLARAAVGAHALGYAVRVDVTLLRRAAVRTRPAPVPRTDRCVTAADTVWLVAQ
ncbi:MAG: hypothetical protein OEO21_08940 [Candidatus Krumholzibacteria bacterium]|nr:hypothetical protein [Candidatus Krumholzibacteria bacterium]